MPLTPAGVDLLLRVRKHILTKPGRLRMSAFVVSKNTLAKNPLLNPYLLTEGKSSYYVTSGRWGEPTKQKIPSCGTIGCIAGWCVLLSIDEDQIDDYARGVLRPFDAAQGLLGITNTEAWRLFYVSRWSQANREAYQNAKTARKRAQLVASEIDLFIKENMPVTATQSTL